MCAGIGGRTIDEAKQRMTYAEYRAWIAYRERHGPLDQNKRLDMAAALIAAVVNQSAGGKATYADFLPKYADEPLTPESAMEKLMGAISGKS